MYKMKADGVVFYDPSSDDMALQVLSPKAKYKLNKAGSLTFTVLPGNVAYNSLHKLKTVITLEQDDEIIFRGRVLETTTDLYNEKKVYCEGELAFLLDSLVRPYQFKGKAADLFRQLVTKHNEQVEDYKQFEVGSITAVTDEDELETEGDGYADTLSEIQSLLLDGFGGYLCVRHEDGKHYLDYVDAFNQTCKQEINFGVNLVDIENKLNAQDVCTVLVPLGKECEGKPATIESVNEGKDYIEDTEGIAKYGRIIKTRTWDECEDPSELLKLAQEYMAVMNAEKTLTITAVALDGIRLGDTVKLLSLPHGLDKEDVCTAIDLDIENPEKSDYTFGFPLETLTESNARTIKGLNAAIHHTHKWLTETDTALNIYVEATNLIGHRTTQLEIDVDAAEEAITLKASQESVDILEEKNTAVELRLDAVEDAILLKADKIDLQGYVTMDDFEARIGEVETSFSEYIMTGEIDAGTAEVGSLIVTGSAAIPHLSVGSIEMGGDTLSKASLTVVTEVVPYLNDDNLVYAVGQKTATIYYYT